MGASQKHNFPSVHFIKESKNMGKHSKYSVYKLSFFELLKGCGGTFNELINDLIEHNDIKAS